MKTKTIVLAVFVSLCLVTTVCAAPAERLNFGSQLNATACSPTGKLVISVVQTITNDADTGLGAFPWALDTFVRQIQVWQSGVNTFCAVVRYQGMFVTFAGQTPAGGALSLSAGITGVFQGGYTATLTGTLKTDADLRGNIGTIDFGCDASGSCQNYVSWVDTYFNGASSTLTFWGWVYTTGTNGVWVNASTGNSGNIHG